LTLGCRVGIALKHARYFQVFVEQCHLPWIRDLLVFSSRICVVFAKETSDFNMSPL
jgi:hypothetical protein